MSGNDLDLSEFEEFSSTAKEQSRKRESNPVNDPGGKGGGRGPRRWLWLLTGLVLGALAYIAGLLVMALVQTPLGLHLGAGILIGIAVSATGFPLVLAAVARSVPEDRRSTWLGFASAGGSIGQFALLPATQGMIGGLGWSGALLGLEAGGPDHRGNALRATELEKCQGTFGAGEIDHDVE